MTETPVLVETRDGIATVTLNRPDQLNPLDWGTIRELRASFERVEADGAVRVAVITGRGRAFSAGGDLKGYLSLFTRPDDLRRYLRDMWDTLDRIERSRLPVIAAVNGPCVAGGIELMLACDLVVASEEARIGDGHLNFGQIPGAGASQRLPRAIGAIRAKELFFTGDLLTGREAERIGLVNRAVPADRLMATVYELAQKILAKSALAVKGIKHLVNEGLRTDLREGLELELRVMHEYATKSRDAMEGLRAFSEKRRPKFTGE